MWGGCEGCGPSGGGDCPVHPDCRRYASKMRGCFPNWDVDQYAACDQIFDICDLGDGCNAHYPTHVRCVLRTNCELIFEDCHPVSCD